MIRSASTAPRSGRLDATKTVSTLAVMRVVATQAAIPQRTALGNSWKLSTSCVKNSFKLVPVAGSVQPTYHRRCSVSAIRYPRFVIRDSWRDTMDSGTVRDVTRRDFLHTSMAGAAGMAFAGSDTLFAQADRDAVVAEIARQHDATVQKLRDWIALPSIAAEDLNYPQGAEYMARLARDAGFTRVDMVSTAGKPGVFATLDVGAPTTLALYFMYDVKQFDPKEWSAPPLEGKIVDRPGVGKIMVGRGAINTKGPQMACLAALHAFKAANRKLPINLVLVCEGEEEIGSPNFRQIVFKPEAEAALRKSVGIIIPLGNQSLDGSVEVNLGAKGIVELELVSSGTKWG